MRVPVTTRGTASVAPGLDFVLPLKLGETPKVQRVHTVDCGKRMMYYLLRCRSIPRVYVDLYVAMMVMAARNADLLPMEVARSTFLNINRAKLMRSVQRAPAPPDGRTSENVRLQTQKKRKRRKRWLLCGRVGTTASRPCDLLAQRRSPLRPARPQWRARVAWARGPQQELLSASSECKRAARIQDLTNSGWIVCHSLLRRGTRQRSLRLRCNQS